MVMFLPKPPQLHFALPFIVVTGERRDFKFGTHVDHSNSQPTDDKQSLKCAWLRHVTHFNLWGHIHISGMAEARVAKAGICCKTAECIQLIFGTEAFLGLCLCTLFYENSAVFKNKGTSLSDFFSRDIATARSPSPSAINKRQSSVWY